MCKQRGLWCHVTVCMFMESRRYWKGVLHHERESGIGSIVGYKRMSVRLERVSLSLSMPVGIWRERELGGNVDGTRIIVIIRISID